MKRLILFVCVLTVYGQVQTLPNNAGSSKAVIDSNFSWLNANKAPLSHVHLVTDVTGLQTALNGKADTGHNHDAAYVAIGGTYVNPSWIFSIDWSKLTSVPSMFAPSAHGGSHQNGGSDEIATATAGANAIPKAGAGGKLDVAWIPDLSATYTRAADKTGGGSKIASAAAVPTDGCANWSAGNLGSTGVACGSGAGGITDLVQDATPQLGGDLDMNTHNIQTVTPTEMTYVHGVTSAIQPQINSKSDLTHNHDTAYVSLGGSYANPSWLTAFAWSKLTSVPSTFAPSAHAATHKNGGSDEVAVAVAAANAIPKADATGKLTAGWIPDLSGSYQAKSEKGAASGYASLDSSTKVPIAQLPTGSTSSTVAIGNDARFSDARTPTAHATTHQNGGSDELATSVAAANAIPKAGAGGTLAPGWLPLPGTSSIGGVQAKDCSAGGQFVQKINADGTETCATPAGGGNVSGPGSSTTGYLPQWNATSGTLLSAGLPVSTTAAANTVAESGAGGKLDIGWIPAGQTGTTVALGNDARFTDARTPTAHASTHLSNGSDAIAAASTTVRGTVTTTTANSQAVSTDDARMTNARTPTAHAATHQNGGADEIATAAATANAIPKAGAGGTLAAGWIPDLSATYQAVSGKNAANGYAGLDAGSRIAKAQNPATAMYTDQSNTLAAFAWDASGASTTKPSKSGASDPAACGPGEQFYNTIQNVLKVCTATNTWTSYAPGGGSGIVNQTTGVGAPSGNCAAPSNSNLTVYSDTTNQDEWFCSATNTWKKLLSTTNSGTYVELGATGIAPSNPSAGYVKCYFDSTANTQICLNSSGNAFIGVKGLSTRVANQFTTYIDAIGIQHQAAIASTDLPTGVNVRALSFTFGDPGGSSALTAGATSTVYVTVPFACTISAWNILADAGTATVKFWKVATGTVIPTSANSINTSGISLASGTAIHSATMTDFTSTAIAANDILAANITAVTTAKYLSVVLQCNQ